MSKKKCKSSFEWLRRVQSGENLISAPASILSNIALTSQEISKHNQLNDCWIILNGTVYDVTKYLEYHPAGADQIMRAAGKDGTSLFNHYHNFVNYKTMLKNCYLGTVIYDHKGSKSPRTKKHDMVEFDWKKSSNGYNMEISIKKEQPIECEDLVVFIAKSHNLIICLKIEDSIFQAYLFYCDEKLSQLTVSLRNKETFLITITTSVKRSIVDLFNKENFTLKHVSSIECSPNFIAEKYFIKVNLISCEPIAKNVHFYKIKIENDFYFAAPLATHAGIRIIGTKHFSYLTFVPPNLIDKTDNTIDDYNYFCPLLDPTSNSYFVYFIVKNYPSHKITEKLKSLKPGDKLEMTPPLYPACFQLNHLSNRDVIYMCSSGVGITVMLRLILYISKTHTETRIKLLCSYQTVEDIVWLDQLNMLALEKPEKFSFKITITRPQQSTNSTLSSSSWQGLTGRINENMLNEFLDVVENSLLYICGSNEFIDDMSEIAEKRFENKNQIIGFKG